MYNIYAIVILILFDIPRFSVNDLHQIQVAAPSPSSRKYREEAAILDFFAKHSTKLVPHTRFPANYVSKTRYKVHVYISHINCGNIHQSNHFSITNYAPIQLQLSEDNTRELKINFQCADKPLSSYSCALTPGESVLKIDVYQYATCG